MKYYVVSDVHGYFSILKDTLEEKGFFNDTEPHMLVVCGDMMDRGQEALEMQDFMLNLLHEHKLIFVRGNHEDLFLQMLNKMDSYFYDIALGLSHHVSNGTWNTALQLAKMDESEALHNTDKLVDRVCHSPFCEQLIPSSLNYYETEHYIFVHGWIPCFTEEPLIYNYTLTDFTYKYNSNWRNASLMKWNRARWENGILCAEKYNIIEPHKTIICGHWNCSYGHYTFETAKEEYGEDADFSPYYGKGVIAIDACTAYSKKINCIVIED